MGREIEPDPSEPFDTPRGRLDRKKLDVLHTIFRLRTEPVGMRRAVVSVLMDALREKHTGNEAMLRYIEERTGPVLKAALGLNTEPPLLPGLDKIDLG